MIGRLADWHGMVNATQLTVQNRDSDPDGLYKAQYDFRDLLGAEILSTTKKSSAMSNITAQIYYAVGNEFFKKRVHINVIRESAPYRPSLDGVWGVNPNSMQEE